VADRSAALTDIAVGLALAAIGAAFVYEGWDLPPGFFEPVGPGPIPSAVAWCVIALAGVVVLRAGVRLATGRLPPREPPPFETRGRDAAAVAALTVAYVAAMGLGLAGFATATMAYLFATIGLLGGWSARTLVPAAIIAVVMGHGLQYLFTRIFVTDLP
jgi:hypothetical protein